jgi:hypothetical protein
MQTANPIYTKSGKKETFFPLISFSSLSIIWFFSFSILKEIDCNSQVRHDLSRLPAKKLLIMDEILNTLLKELNTTFNMVAPSSIE